MFYLKYRPQKFSELVRPNEIADALMQQVKNDNLSHAYLFTGPRGTGKTTTARLLAKAANCLNIEPNGDPCDECENCIAVKKGNFLDLIEIDAASNRGIDDIRNLRDRIGLAPSQGKKKVYIIDEVHMLTKEAFNALLKTLEEPPKHALFVLCTTEPHKVLDTIKSRCQVFNFKRASVPQIIQKIERISVEEDVEISEEVKIKIAQASFGGYRDAETMLQQVVQGNLDPDALFGFSSYKEFHDFVNHLLGLEPVSAIEMLEEVYKSGVDMQVWSYSLLDYFKELLFTKMGTSGKSIEVTDELREDMVLQAKNLSVKDLVFCTKKFLEARNLIAESNISTLPLELAVAEICSSWGADFSKDVSPSDSPKGNPGGKDTSGGSDLEDTVVKSKRRVKKDKPSSNKKGSKSKSEEEVRNGRDKEDTPIDITAEEIQKKWNDVLRASRKYNNSVRALLKSAKAKEIKGNEVVLEVQFAFHKDRLEYNKNRKIVERVLEEVFELPLTISCCVEKKDKPKKGRETGNLTDFNLVVPKVEESNEVTLDDSLLDVFDGTLPGV